MNLSPYVKWPLDVLAHHRLTIAAVESLEESRHEADDFSTVSLFGLDQSTFRIQINGLREESNQQSMLLLMASIEAVFQVDLHRRVERRLKDRASTALRRYHRRLTGKKRRIEVEGILDEWKSSVAGIAESIGQLKQAIAYRHWLAHGRYWVQHSGLNNPDLLDFWNRWISVEQRIAVDFEFPLQ